MHPELCQLILLRNLTLLVSGRSIFDFTSYIKSMDEGDNRDWWTSFEGVGILDYNELQETMIWWEELRKSLGKAKAVERYSYASTTRVNQGARLGDYMILDQFTDQIGLNGDPAILKNLAENIAVMTLSNEVAHNRNGGTLGELLESRPCFSSGCSICILTVCFLFM